MNTIELTVKNREIIPPEECLCPVQHNVNKDRVKFVFADDEFADMKKYLAFYQRGMTPVIIDWPENNEVPIPPEATANVGEVFCSITGESTADTSVLLTCEMRKGIMVRKSGKNEGDLPSEPTLTTLARIDALAADLEQKRDTDYWRGEPGRDADIAGAEAAIDAANEAAESAERAYENALSAAIYARDTATDLRQAAVLGEFNGEDGFSPTAAVTKEGRTTTITITDRDGTTSVEILDAPPYDDSALRARIAALEEQLASQDTSNLWGVSFAGSSNTQGVQRLYAASSLGMLTYATETEKGYYPFDKAEPWIFTHWLVRYDGDGYPVKVASMTMDGVKSPGWDENAMALDRFVEFPNAWFMRDDDAGIYLVSSVEREGFTRFYAKPDGTEPDMLPLIPCYKMGNAAGSPSASTGVGCSRPGMKPHWGTFSQHRALQQSASARGHGGTTWFENWKQVMCYVELASRDVQGALDYNGKYLPGFSGGCYTNSADYNAVAASSDNTNTVQLVNATNYFAVGQTVNVCQGWISSDKISYRRITAISGNSVTLDGEPFSVEAGWFMYNMDYATGHTDGLLGHTGATTLSNNRFGMKWRGIEDLWGGSAEDIIDIRLTCAGSVASDGYDVHFCDDALKAQLAGDEPSADYVISGMNLQRFEGYIKLCQQYGGDKRLVLPKSVAGASSTTYMADYCWTSSGYADNRSVRSGYYWYAGSSLGVFSRNCYYAASAGSRYYCSRLFLEP